MRQKTTKPTLIIMIIFVFNVREKVGTKIILIPLQNSSIKQSDKMLQATAAALSNGCTL